MMITFTRSGGGKFVDSKSLEVETFLLLNLVLKTHLTVIAVKLKKLL